MKKLGFSAKDKKSNLKNRQLSQQRNVVRLLSKSNEPLTIPQIAILIKTSIPTGTKVIKELVENNYVLEEGKKETDNGRRPTVYTLNLKNFYVVGVEILTKFIHVSIVRIDMETVFQAVNRQFILENTVECLNYITSFIQTTIKDSGIENHQIVGVGVGMTGSVNGHTGEPLNYFNTFELPFKTFLENSLGVPVFVDNDTRAIGTAEQVLGIAKGVENVLVVKVSRHLGLSIILNRKTIVGAMGFSGNFAHTQFEGGERLCNCGKKGCLGTKIAGDALKNDLEEALQNGEKSLYFTLNNVDSYQYHDILDASLNGDALSIQLLQKQGDVLGQALGNVVNLLNPDLIVIGGEFVMVKDFFIDAIKMGIKKTALVDTLANCRIEASTLGRYLSSKAGACMLLKAFDMIEH